jgi:hypothetical protein
VELASRKSDELMMRGCNWLHDYFETNRNVSESDRHPMLKPKNKKNFTKIFKPANL